MSSRIGRTSIKVKYQIASYGLFLIILLLGSISLLKLDMSTRLSNDIIHRSINQMHHAMVLRISANEAAMPVNDYIISASPDEKRLYLRLRDRVESEFDTLAAMNGFMPGQLDVLDKARDEWRNAKLVADSIMAIRQPVGNPLAAERMEAFDLLIDDASLELKKLYDAVYAENLHSSQDIQSIQQHTTMVVAALFLAALGLVVYGMIWVPRSVFHPIRNVSKGMQRLRQGDHDCRVDTDVPLEFISLVDGFNDMVDELKERRRD